MQRHTFVSLLVCGLLLGGSAGAFQKARQAEATPAAPVATTQPTESVWVSRPDGGQSCAPGSAQSVEDGARELAQAGVKVLTQSKGQDDQMHMQVCGAATGSQNAYEIPKSDLDKALKLGFSVGKPASLKK